ncbi:uncharacterized protein LOC135373491 [Ornithodoros turicata]|uniref:uncharacterized protein LOC135373491 n=1 Tax=Ornithodoros turicata TaxID=34597 RepID=UPI00313A149E
MKTYLVGILLLNACLVIAQDREKCKRNILSTLVKVSGRVLSCKYRCLWTRNQYEYEDDGTPCLQVLAFAGHGVCYNGNCVNQLPHPTGKFYETTEAAAGDRVPTTVETRDTTQKYYETTEPADDERFPTTIESRETTDKYYEATEPADDERDLTTVETTETTDK